MVGAFTLHVGDVLEQLRAFPSESVQRVVCSPPYWRLRDYGTGAWEGGRSECDHLKPAPGGTKRSSLARPENAVTQDHIEARMRSVSQQYESLCKKCGARRVDRQLGLEPTMDDHVAAMVRVFREVRRVLRDDGVLWLNYGDSYFAQRNENGHVHTGLGRDRTNDGQGTQSKAGLPRKNLVLMPARIALALQDDGWIVRAEVIWAKGLSFCDSYAGSCMPESVRDRPTRAHETLFLLSKSPKYYFDDVAVRETGVYPEGTKAAKGSEDRAAADGVNSRPAEYAEYSGTRNLRDVWAINPQPFPGAFCLACSKFFRGSTQRFRQHEDENGVKRPICPNCGIWSRWLAHFATFPEDIVEPCVRAGPPEGGSCTSCGAPFVRQTELSEDYRERLVQRFRPQGIGEFLKAARGSRTQSEVAALFPSRTGGTTGCVSNWELGKNVPTAQQWSTLKDFLGFGDEMDPAIAAWHSYERGDCGEVENALAQGAPSAPPAMSREEKTVGFRPGCDCPDAKARPAIVLDPFMGSGTTAIVATSLDREAIGIELSEDYAAMAEARYKDASPLFARFQRIAAEGGGPGTSDR